jgi:glycosyltransferase involved in cell wall biosynthesis
MIVRHFGPDPATVGGMATVIRIFTEHRVGGEIVDCHPTWRPGSSMRSATLVVGGAARRLMRMRAGEVAHIHLSEKGSFVREGALVALARKRGLPTVATMHGASFMPFAEQHPALARAVLRQAHVVTCLDRETLEFVRSNAPKSISTMVPNPIYVEDGFLPADQTEELILFAGEIGLRKGADVLWRAWQLVAQRRPGARCLMVGPTGDYSPAAAERLEVRAPVDARQMQALLRRARVVTLPSRAEKMPMVLTEAMSMGRPFVSTPVGGIPELAQEGGTLVPVDDEVALADALTSLLADPARARVLGEQARRFCQQTRSVDAVGARFRELYSLAAATR